jgi:hypothetical protein
VSFSFCSKKLALENETPYIFVLLKQSLLLDRLLVVHPNKLDTAKLQDVSSSGLLYFVWELA